MQMVVPEPVSFMPEIEQLALPVLVTVAGSVLVLPTVVLPNWITRPYCRHPIGVGWMQLMPGETWMRHTGEATGDPSSSTLSCGRDGSLESNSTVPLSVGFVSVPGGAYCTVEVNASPGRSV